MREIKFRVWDERDKVLVNWEDAEETPLLFDAFKGKEAIAQQFTGLLDKNGKEIYEGDIMRQPWSYCDIWNNFKKMSGEHILTVCWCNCWTQVGWRLRDYTQENQYGINIDTEIAEIIGNIFENPELIK